MPSVRVRRGSQYASLLGEDGVRNETPGRPRSRTLASIYRPEGPLVPENNQTGEPSSSNGRQDLLNASDPLQVGNDRQNGRVADSILNGSRPPQAIRGYRSHDVLRDRPPRMSPDSVERKSDGAFTLEGAQANIVVPSNGSGKQGILESNLSLASAASNPFQRSIDDPRHHEDDIVEHLDVIDPEIATISNLANAANSILIPPIGIYSRKPVVFLPRVPVSDDMEKSQTHEDDLDRHVEEVLSKRTKIRRTLRGVWAFVKTPLGIVAAFYGFCVVFWGAAIVFFLAKFINFHNPSTQGFWVEVSSQIENALFTVTGIGLIPWRVVDTYRILRIWHYKKLTRKLRAKAKLPELFDLDDLPDPRYDPNYVHVLSEGQEKSLHHHQRQFAKSQTWYRAHGTPTHRAFPIETALLICLFIDGNSIFQIILCGTMWGLNRFQRPAWSTGILIPASFLCGIASAVFIWRGGQKTKRTKEVEDRLRLALAIEHNPEKYRVVEAKGGSQSSADEASEQENIRIESGSGSRDSGSVAEHSSDEQGVRSTSPRHEAAENSGRNKNVPPIDRNPSVIIDEHMEVEVPPPNALH